MSYFFSHATHGIYLWHSLLYILINHLSLVMYLLGPDRYQFANIIDRYWPIADISYWHICSLYVLILKQAREKCLDWWYNYEVCPAEVDPLFSLISKVEMLKMMYIQNVCVCVCV